MKRKKERRPFNKTRLKNQFLNVVTNPFNMIVAITLIILFCLIVIPLLQMIASTFTVGTRSEAREAGAAVGDFTLYYWKYILTSYLSKATLWGPLKNSLVIGFFTVVVSVPLGAILAWLIVRTDIPGKKLLGMLVVIPYMIPSWCKALSWLAVFRNKTSGALGFLAGLGIPIPDWLAYGPVAIVLCMSLHYYAFSYIQVSSALRSINSELEEMGEICGASKPQILKSITLPLVMPSLLSAVVMTLSKSIGGKGGRSTEMRLGKAKAPLMIFCVLFLFLAMVMPMFVLVMETFQVTTGNGYALSNLTLYNWIGTVDEAQKYTSYPGIFRNPEFGKAMWNTIRLTAIGSILTAFCGQFLGYISTRGRGKWYGSLTEQLVFVPYLMSGVAFSSMYVAMFSRPRLGGLIPSLYGTFALIVLTSVVKHFPFASRSGTANMMQISTELEEAADINGASFWQRMGKIVLPLAKNGFISGFMLTFISIAKELDLIIIMMDKHTQTMSYPAFTYSQEGMNQMADAISVCVLLFILVCYIIANKFGADIGKAW